MRLFIFPPTPGRNEGATLGLALQPLGAWPQPQVVSVFLSPFQVHTEIDGWSPCPGPLRSVLALAQQPRGLPVTWGSDPSPSVSPWGRGLRCRGPASGPGGMGPVGWGTQRRPSPPRATLRDCHRAFPPSHHHQLEGRPPPARREVAVANAFMTVFALTANCSRAVALTGPTSACGPWGGPPASSLLRCGFCCAPSG